MRQRLPLRARSRAKGCGLPLRADGCRAKGCGLELVLGPPTPLTFGSLDALLPILSLKGVPAPQRGVKMSDRGWRTVVPRVHGLLAKGCHPRPSSPPVTCWRDMLGRRPRSSTLTVVPHRAGADSLRILHWRCLGPNRLCLLCVFSHFCSLICLCPADTSQKIHRCATNTTL